MKALRLDLLTPAQIGWLTTVQIQSRQSSELILVNPFQIPLLTTEQMAGLPDDYNIRLWSDEQQAALTREQLLALPYPVLQILNGLFPEMTPPSNYMPVVMGHNHGVHEAEAAGVLNLVPIEAATHRTIASGNWSDPRIWSGGVLPGAQRQSFDLQRHDGAVRRRHEHGDLHASHRRQARICDEYQHAAQSRHRRR